MALVFNNNGTYWTYLGKRDGKTFRASTGIRVAAPTPSQVKENKKTAEAIANAARAEWNLNKHGLTTAPTLEAPTFEAFADTWEQEWGILQRGYEERIPARLKMLKKVFGTYRITDITPDVVHTWRAQRLAAKTAPRTVNRDVDLMKSILSKGAPRYYVDSPLRRMPRLKAPPPIVQTLEPAAEEKILTALSDEDKAIFLVALDGLVRLGDVLSLRWSDVMADGMLRIRHDKTGKTHTVPLSQRAQAALSTIQPNPLDRGARVFATRGGDTRQHGATYTQMLKRLCKRLGIPFGRTQGGITFHGATRHTGATRLTASGVDLRTVQEIGGWSNISMLQRYVHPSTAVLRSAVEKIGAST